MGTAYCLQHMHEMNPPMAHSDFNSSEIYLTDDYAAKVSSNISENVSLKVLLLHVSNEVAQEHVKLFSQIKKPLRDVVFKPLKRFV